MNRPTNPEESARLEAMKRSWEQRRSISQNLAHIKTKLSVYSGKGGVGKTTVAVNLAVALAQDGAKVGLMDADVDCPNVTGVLDINSRGQFVDGKFIPPEKYGVKVVSMSFFQQKEDEAIIWRGPMIHHAITEFLQVTQWGDLDYLVVDLPPGTSDAPLTVMQTVQVDGFVVVTTPQALSKLDAKRSINMIKRMNVSVLGVVENMAGEMFGQGAGEEIAKELEIPFLGRLALRQEYRSPVPPVMTSDAVRQEYAQIVKGVKAQLEALGPRVQKKPPLLQGQG